MYYILSLKPNLSSKSDNFIHGYLCNYYNQINALIDSEISTLPVDEYLYIGFSTQFYQWIGANIIIERIRRIYPKAIFIAGGCGTSIEAKAFMRNFKNFNLASWGEGEFSLLQVTRYFDKSISHPIELAEIPNIVYREDGIIKTNKIPNVYVNLDNNQPNYADYFQQLTGYRLPVEPKIPIEKGRGCHWKRCHFCFLNSGYKFRVKKAETVLREIEAAFKDHPTNKFIFVDNDLIANDPEGFHELLDLLIGFRNKHNGFKVLMAEIITEGITSEILKKMVFAGFEKIQIGYESTSNNLLRKISKKNTFASNLLCVKWGIYYGLKFGGVNVLRNLLEETNDDIKEAIKNLYYLRFFIQKDIFFHNMSLLAIAKCSKYFHKIGEAKRRNYSSSIWSFLPVNYIQDEDKYTLIMDFTDSNYKRLWDVFEKVESHYLKNNYSYRLIDDNGTIHYRESYNLQDIKELEFENRTSLHWRILRECNHIVRSLDELLKLEFPAEGSTNKEYMNDVVDLLKAEGLLYCNDDKSQIVSIVNTDLIAEC